MAYRSSTIGSVAAGGSTTLTVNKPAGVVAGDLLYAAIVFRSSSITTVPAGWTLIGGEQAIHAADGITLEARMRVYRLVAGASEPASYSWVIASSNDHVGTIVALSGRDNTVPETAHSGQTEVDANGSTTIAAMTATAGDDLVAFAVITPATSWTPPAGMTERQDGNVSGGSGTTATVATEDAVGAGTTGPLAFTDASATKMGAGMGILVRAAGALPVISHVGFGSAQGTNQATVGVTTVQVGNLVVLTLREPSAVTVTGVSGGNVTGWTHVVTEAGVGRTIEQWYGVVNATGAATITVTYSGTPGGSCDLAADEYQCSVACTWAPVTSGGIDNTSSTTVTLPTLTFSAAAGSQYLYAGGAWMAGSGISGLTAGFTSEATALGEIVYWLNTNPGTFVPTYTSSAGTSTAVAAIFGATPTGGGGGGGGSPVSVRELLLGV